MGNGILPPNAGMLWFDSSNRSLEHKVSTACGYYRRMRGRNPRLVVHVHPSALPEGVEELVVGYGFLVKANPSIQKDHLWIGEHPDDQ